MSDRISTLRLQAVRREDDRIRRYVHLGTGNDNARTAETYSDCGLLSADEPLCEDVTQLFNVVTGCSRPSASIGS